MRYASAIGDALLKGDTIRGRGRLGPLTRTVFWSDATSIRTPSAGAAVPAGYAWIRVTHRCRVAGAAGEIRSRGIEP